MRSAIEVSGGQLLAEAVIAVDPRDRRVVAVLGDRLAAWRRDGVVRVVVDLGTGDDRHPLVEEIGETAIMRVFAALARPGR